MTQLIAVYNIVIKFPMPRLSRCCAAVLLTLLAVFASKTQAQPTGLSAFHADRMVRDYDKHILSLDGHVHVIFGGHYLSCDRAEIDTKLHRLVAKGHVILQKDNLYAEASRLEFDYKTELGTLYDGFVQSGQVVFQGKVIRKTGPLEYEADDARYTACTNCAPSWSFRGSNIKAQFGGYAKIKYPVFYLGSVPVMILPKIIVPLKSKRESGFLVPSWSISKNGGFAFEESYFWAISRSQDMTTTLKREEKRGLKPLIEYRYVLTPKSKGDLHTAFIHDRNFLSEEVATGKADRAFLNYNHHMVLPHNSIQRLNLNFSTDLRYPRDFPSEMPGHGEPALENKTSITHNTDDRHLSYEATYYINLLEAEATAKNDTSVHRVPEIRYSLIQSPLLGSPLQWQLDLNYVNFARRNFSYDDVNEAVPVGGSNANRKALRTHDSFFNPDTDLIRTGHRLEAIPAVSWPIQIYKSMILVPKIEYRETQYRFTARPETLNSRFSHLASRRYFTSDLLLKTLLSRTFGHSKMETRYKHEIEPSVSFSKTHFIKRPEHGFFGNFEEQSYSNSFQPISDEDFFGENGLQFDYKDRIFDKENLNFTIANQLVQKKTVGSRVTYNTVARLSLSQSFDFRENERNTKEPLSPLDAILYVALENFDTLTTASYQPYAQITDFSSRARVKDSVGNFFELIFSRKFTILADNRTSFKDRQEKWGSQVGWVGTYFNLIGAVNYSPVSSQIQSWSYNLKLKPPGDCLNVLFGHTQVVGGDLIFKFNFDFRFAGPS